MFLTFSALLPVVNPVGSAVIFLEFAEKADMALRKVMARKIAFNSMLFLVIVQFAGTHLLAFFGISLPIVQVAGGFVLAMMGYAFLNQPRAAGTVSQSSETREQFLGKTFYPLTFPITIGPGCMVVMLALSARVDYPGLVDTVLSQSGIVLGALLMCAIIYFSYIYAERVFTKISASAAEGMLKIISFILLCIGVQIMWHGIQSLMGRPPAPA